MAKELAGKTIVITGATSGIGFAAARELTSRGAWVIGVGRSPERNAQAKKEILAEEQAGRIDYLLADLANQTRVRELAKAIYATLQRAGTSVLDVLINNAGIYLERKVLTEDGIEKTFAVNHLAPFLLTHLLMPALTKSKKPRVLTTSSYAHYTTWLCLNRITNPRPYVGLLAYKRSKLSNVLFSYELNRRYTNLQAFAIDPGLVDTGIGSKGGKGISHFVWSMRRNQGESPEKAAETFVYLAGESDLKTSDGVYFKDCAPLTPSPKARREDLAKELWDLSSRLTGLEN